MRLYAALAVGLLALVLGGGVSQSQAANFYWDTNGTDPGAGAVPNGVWDASTANWQTTTPDPPNPEIPADSTGVNTPGVWVADKTAVFSAGSDATSPYTVTLAGPQSAAGINFEDGTPTITGNTLTLTSAHTVTAAPSVTGTISSVIAGTVGLKKAGDGTLKLTANNTFSGGLELAGGVVQYNGESSATAGSANPLGQYPGSATPGHINVTASSTLRNTRVDSSGLVSFILPNRGITIGNSAVLSFQVADAGSILLANGAIAGPGRLAIIGPGTVRITNTTSATSNSYTGGTEITGGKLVFPGELNGAAGSNNPLGAAPAGITLNNIVMDNNAILSTTRVGAEGTSFLHLNRSVTLNSGGGTWDFAAPSSTIFQYAGSISGAGRLSLTNSGGAGTLLKLLPPDANASTWTGGIRIGSNVVVEIPSVSGITKTALGPNPASPTANQVILDGGTLRQTNGSSGGSFVMANVGIELTSNGGTLDYSIANAHSILNANNIISGPGSFTKAGGGALSIASACTYTGDTIINAGELRMRTASDRLPTTTNVIINGSGILNLNGSGVNQTIASLASTSAAARVGTASSTLTINGAADTVFEGALVNTANIGAGASTATFGRLIKAGIGSITFNGVNDITGSVTLNSGGITVGPAGMLCGAVADLTVNGGTLTLNQPAQTVENLSGTGGTIALGTGHVLTTDPVASTSYAGTITGDGGFTKTNALSAATRRTLTLTGDNSYAGGTTVDGGTLLVNNTTGSGTGSGGVIVNGGAASPAIFGGTGAVSGTVTVNSGGTLAPGASIESLDTGAVTFNSGSTFAIELDSLALPASGADRLNVVTGGLDIVDGAKLSLTDIAATSTALTNGTRFSLIAYSGGWDNDLFRDALDQPITDGGSVTVGANTFTVDYDDTTEGDNFTGGSFTNFVSLLVNNGTDDLPGDYNENDVVDAADYVIWRMNEVANADLPNDNDVGNQPDRYTLWTANFGNTPSAAAANSLGNNQAVPEPATLALLMLGAAATSLCRRARKR